MKKLILIEKSNNDMLTDLLMCNAKKLLDYYGIKEFKRVSYNEINLKKILKNIKVDQKNLPILLFLENETVINYMEGFQYLDFIN